MMEKIIAISDDYELKLIDSEIRQTEGRLYISYRYALNIITDSMRETLAKYCDGVAYSIVMGALRGAADLRLETDIRYEKAPENKEILNGSPNSTDDGSGRRRGVMVKQEHFKMNTQLYVPIESAGGDKKAPERLSFYSLSEEGGLGAVFSALSGKRYYRASVVSGAQKENSVEAYADMCRLSKKTSLTSADDRHLYLVEPHDELSDQLEYLPAAVFEILLNEQKEKIFDEYRIRFLSGNSSAE